jgi:MFS family permease
MQAALTARIRRRNDIYLLPFLSFLFLLSSLDRSNIGNAETAGFTRHAGLNPEDLNDAVAAFFVLFVLLQPVGAALGKRVGVRRWVGGVMIGWGVLTGLTAFVRTRGQLILLRVCIGALEAGFYPATVFYLSLFYTRYEFAQRLGLFYGQYAVAGAFGGLVSCLVFRIFPSGPSQTLVILNTQSNV